MTFILHLGIKWLVYTGVLFISSKILEGFIVNMRSLWTLGLVFLGLDYLLRWLLVLLSAPVNFLTLGIFSLIIAWVINVAIIWVTDKISRDLEIKNNMSLFLAGLILSVARFGLGKILS